MRKDMAKVIVERPRRGGKYSRPGREAKSLTSLPSKQSMKSAHKDRKTLNENLAPLKRFLRSRIGRQWDSVFSEICENIRLTSAVQKHVRDHVFDYVHLNVVFEGKTVLSQRRYYGKHIELFNGDFYVDTMGALREYLRPKKKRTATKRHRLETELNDLLGHYKVRVLVQNDEIVRQERSIPKGEWTVSISPRAAHARIDAKMIVAARFEESVQLFLKNWIQLKDSENFYLATLHSELESNLKKKRDRRHI